MEEDDEDWQDSDGYSAHDSAGTSGQHHYEAPSRSPSPSDFPVLDLVGLEPEFEYQRPTRVVELADGSILEEEIVTREATGLPDQLSDTISGTSPTDAMDETHGYAIGSNEWLLHLHTNLSGTISPESDLEKFERESRDSERLRFAVRVDGRVFNESSAYIKGLVSSDILMPPHQLPLTCSPAANSTEARLGALHVSSSLYDCPVPSSHETPTNTMPPRLLHSGGTSLQPPTHGPKGKSLQAEMDSTEACWAWEAQRWASKSRGHPTLLGPPFHQGECSSQTSVSDPAQTPQSPHSHPCTRNAIGPSHNLPPTLGPTQHLSLSSPQVRKPPPRTNWASIFGGKRPLSLQAARDKRALFLPLLLQQQHSSPPLPLGVARTPIQHDLPHQLRRPCVWPRATDGPVFRLPPTLSPTRDNHQDITPPTLNPLPLSPLLPFNPLGLLQCPSPGLAEVRAAPWTSEIDGVDSLEIFFDAMEDLGEEEITHSATSEITYLEGNTIHRQMVTIKRVGKSKATYCRRIVTWCSKSVRGEESTPKPSSGSTTLLSEEEQFQDAIPEPLSLVSQPQDTRSAALKRNRDEEACPHRPTPKKIKESILLEGQQEYYVTASDLREVVPQQPPREV